MFYIYLLPWDAQDERLMDPSVLDELKSLGNGVAWALGAAREVHGAMAPGAVGAVGAVVEGWLMLVIMDI